MSHVSRRSEVLSNRELLNQLVKNKKTLTSLSDFETNSELNQSSPARHVIPSATVYQDMTIDEDQSDYGSLNKLTVISPVTRNKGMSFKS